MPRVLFGVTLHLGQTDVVFAIQGYTLRRAKKGIFNLIYILKMLCVKTVLIKCFFGLKNTGLNPVFHSYFSKYPPKMPTDILLVTYKILVWYLFYKSAKIHFASKYLRWTNQCSGFLSLIVGNLPLQLPTIFVSNLCYLIKLLQLLPERPIYSPFVALSIFVVLSNFCHFLTLCYLLTFLRYLRIVQMHLLYTSQTKTLSCLIVRTRYAPIYLSNSPGVFGNRAILIWGIEAWLGIFSKNK